MPEFRIVHVGDGANVAESIGKKFTRVNPQLSVELHNLRRRTSSSSSQSSSSSSQPSFSSSQSSSSLASSTAADVPADISVLLATPAMLKYLDDMILTDQDRTVLTNLMKTEQPSVALSCYVDVLELKEKLLTIFNENELSWRFLEVGKSKKSFQLCMVELMTMLEEGPEEMPMPTLKQYHLLPDKPVLAQDTIYILMDKHLADSNDEQSLNVVFKDGSQVTATLAADYLYQFEAPESSEPSKAIEVFSSEGESLGTDTIRYRDKLQVFAEVFKDLLHLAKVSSPHTSKEMMESMIAEWMTSEDCIQTLLVQWVKSIKIDKIDMRLMLPHLVYLCVTNDLSTVAQSLVRRLRQSETADSLFRDESLEEDQEHMYTNNRSSELLEGNEESTEEGQGHEYANYRSLELFEANNEDDTSSSSGIAEIYEIPGEIIVEYRDSVDNGNIPGRKTSAVSACLPRATQHKCEGQHLSKSCPSSCGKHAQTSACYENIPIGGELKTEAATYTFPDSPVSSDLSEPQLKASDNPTSLHEIKTTPTVTDRPTGDAGNVRPALPPPRGRRGNTVQHTAISTKSQHRLSMTSSASDCTSSSSSMTSSTLSLSTLYDSKRNFYGHSTVRMFPSSSKSVLSSSTLSLPRLCGQAGYEYSNTPVTSPDEDTTTVQNRLPPIPYSCRPSPPIPKTGSLKLDHQRSARDGLYLHLRAHTAGRQQQMPVEEEDVCSAENVSDDGSVEYSQPNEDFSKDGQSNGVLQSDSYSEQDAIYNDPNDDDESSGSFQVEQLTEESQVYDVPRKAFHRSVSADVAPAPPQSPVPTSPVSPDAPTSHKKSSSRSSPWSSLIKRSLKKPGKPKQQNTKL
ncbi:hypothetical protein BsWGS_08928 [Bradybaena similaris]